MPHRQPVYIEGMGVLGSLLAWELELKRIPFTWYDSGSEINAWRASTGCIYPSGHADEREAYDAWAVRINQNGGTVPVSRAHLVNALPWDVDFPNVVRPAGITERAAFWYVTQKPPHDFKGKEAAELGVMRLHPLPSYHLNPQRLVLQTREAFGDRREVGPLSDRERERRPVVIAHGFGRRLVRYVWGWSARVNLTLDRALTKASGKGVRPAFYLRQNRFTMAYAYPVAGSSGEWYAGSATIVQSEPRDLNIIDKYDAWKERLERLAAGNVKVKSLVSGSIQQGWRPDHAKHDTLDIEVIDRERRPPVIIFPSAGHSGVRMSPRIIKQTIDALEDA
jgi:hypothetical protein